MVSHLGLERGREIESGVIQPPDTAKMQKVYEADVFGWSGSFPAL